MAQKNIRGVQQREEINPRLDRRDVRPLGEKFRDWVESGEAISMFLVLSLGTMFMFPQIIEIVAIFSLLFFRWAGKQRFTLSFRLPSPSRLPDYNDPKPGSNDPSPARGIAFLGNEMGTNRELWFNKSDMCTHILVFGSTGAGKALRDEEDVLTPQGWRKMKDLRVGDEVFTPDRQISTISEIFPQGDQPLWRMEFDDGRFIDITPDHLWGVKTVKFDDSWNIDETLGGGVDQVISTDEIEQMIFDRVDLADNEHLCIPLPEAVGDSVAVWDLTVEEMADAAERALRDSHVDFPHDWIKGSVKQREATWGKIKKMGKALADVHYFDSPNKNALKTIQKLCWSLGHWAKITLTDPSQPNSWSLIVKPYQRWLKISAVTPLYTEEPCRCIKISDQQGLFITKDWIVTHNTETLISLAYNALATGSGFIYVDGKGDNGLWAKIFSVVRYLGREDDLLVINYMTGGRDVTGPQKQKPSNTLNPFTTGSAAGLTELLVGLMDEAGGDNAMWKGRAISLISALMLALVHLRDNDGLLLGVETIRDNLLLENIQKLAKRRDLPLHVLQAIKAYLRSLPGYQENAPKQSETVMDQHGYLQMQFTRIMGSLADI